LWLTIKLTLEKLIPTVSLILPGIGFSSISDLLSSSSILERRFIATTDLMFLCAGYLFFGCILIFSRSSFLSCDVNSGLTTGSLFSAIGSVSSSAYGYFDSCIALILSFINWTLSLNIASFWPGSVLITG